MKFNKNNLTDDQLTFKVEKFEGPLDLLLHLIKQNKMDIYDIPMAEITDQYINYLHQMHKLKLDVAGEYLVTAAMLINIKSKMLLPTEKEEITDEDEMFEDPREELVQQLLVHQTFQEAANQMQTLAHQRQQLYARDQAEIPADAYIGKLSDETMSADLLQHAFARMIAQKQVSKPIQRKLETEKYTIKGEIKRIRHQISQIQEPIRFESLFSEHVETEELVTTFLALLELAKQGELVVMQSIQLGPIMLEKGI
ncbi:segregation and condensation protein A [Ligilactobacillus sp. LYQ135]